MRSWPGWEQPPRLLERLRVGGHWEAGGQGLVVVQQRRCRSEVETVRNGSAHRDIARERAVPTHRMGCLGRILRWSFVQLWQQNTHTGRLTEAMLDGVFLRARELVDTASSWRSSSRT